MEQPRQHRSGFKRRLYALLGLLAIVGAVLGGLAGGTVKSIRAAARGSYRRAFEPPQPVGITGLTRASQRGSSPRTLRSPTSAVPASGSVTSGQKPVVVNFWATSGASSAHWRCRTSPAQAEPRRRSRDRVRNRRERVGSARSTSATSRARTAEGRGLLTSTASIRTILCTASTALGMPASFHRRQRRDHAHRERTYLVGQDGRGAA